MAKKVKAVVKIQIQGGRANPAPPVGTALGPHGINLMQFCKEYNAKTSNQVGQVVPVEVTVFQDGSFKFQRGPLFHNLVLADEINRAPAKVQSALLEAMAERQITVGAETYALPEVFLVMATQNPLEQEGTYPLPEAQLDRFLMHVRVDYPNAEEEKQILHLTRDEARNNATTGNSDIPRLNQQTLLSARQAVLDTYLASNLEDYIIELVLATRQPDRYGDDLLGWIQYGASPRASMALDRCARAYAWLEGRDFVTPDDIQVIAADVLRHRIILSYEAEADGITPDRCIEELIARVAVP